MASIPSPTGEEKQLARALVDVMNAERHRRLLPADRRRSRQCDRSNRGKRRWRDLLLYAPSGYRLLHPRGRRMSVDRRPIAGGNDDQRAIVRDGDVVGMGAENPKGYAACVVAAAQAIKSGGRAVARFAVGRIGSGRHADKPAADVAKVQCRSRRGLRFHVGAGRARRFRDHRQTGLVGRLGRGGIVLVQGDRAEAI